MRGKHGRANIKYSQYKPLQKTRGDERDDNMSEWSMRSSSTLGSIPSDHGSGSYHGGVGTAEHNFGQSRIGRDWVNSMFRFNFL